jgi:hypothetical protein
MRWLRPNPELRNVIVEKHGDIISAAIPADDSLMT